MVTDHKLRLRALQEYREKGDDEGLLFALNEGIHGNMGGMGKSILYQCDPIEQ